MCLLAGAVGILPPGLPAGAEADLFGGSRLCGFVMDPTDLALRAV